jgi:hypothetical protein
VTFVVVTPRSSEPIMAFNGSQDIKAEKATSECGGSVTCLLYTYSNSV